MLIKIIKCTCIIKNFHFLLPVKLPMPPWSVSAVYHWGRMCMWFYFFYMMVVKMCVFFLLLQIAIEFFFYDHIKVMLCVWKRFFLVLQKKKYIHKPNIYTSCYTQSMYKIYYIFCIANVFGGPSGDCKGRWNWCFVMHFASDA